MIRDEIRDTLTADCFFCFCIPGTCIRSILSTRYGRTRALLLLLIRITNCGVYLILVWTIQPKAQTKGGDNTRLSPVVKKSIPCVTAGGVRTVQHVYIYSMGGATRVCPLWWNFLGT